MKKLLPLLVLISLALVVVLPVVVGAQTTPNDCCRIRRNITFDANPPTGQAGSCTTGQIAGPPAADNPTCVFDGVTQTPNCISSKWGLVCMLNTVNIIVDWVFIVLVTISILLAILGAYYILTAGGDPGKVSTGRMYAVYMVVGLIIAFIARAIPSIARAALGY